MKQNCFSDNQETLLVVSRFARLWGDIHGIQHSWTAGAGKVTG